MRRAIPIVLTDAQREELQRLSRGRRILVRLAQRASIVLLAADGLENRQTAGRFYLDQQIQALRVNAEVFYRTPPTPLLAHYQDSYQNTISPSDLQTAVPDITP